MTMKLLVILNLILLALLQGCHNVENTDHSNHSVTKQEELYTCPMHTEIIRNKPGQCPICGMDLVKVESHEPPQSRDIELESLLKPTNQFVISSIPVTAVQKRAEQVEIEAPGYVTYNAQEIGSIAARVTGRIERLYVRNRFEKIKKGQHILDVYSPELMTAQENLLLILKNDATNEKLLTAAKEKLLLLGMSQKQLHQVIQSRKPAYSIAVYSNYSGHIHESGGIPTMGGTETSMSEPSFITEELSLKEGMYVQKGQTIFTVYNPEKIWVILNIYAEHQNVVKKGDKVRLVPETNTKEVISGKIDFIEPFYRSDSKNLTARVYLNNAGGKIPIGTQVSAIIYGKTREGYWLPRESILSLGNDKIVFIKTQDGFKAHPVNIGIAHENHIEVISGLTETDSIALNAQFLMDSESFIRVPN